MIWRVLILSMLPVAAAAADVKISDAWVPLAPPGAMAHAAYLKIDNLDDAPVDIVGVSAERYGMAHLHQTAESNGVSSMSPVHHIQIPAGASLEMVPGEMHIMLMRPQAPVKLDDIVRLTFEFGDGDTAVFDAIVRDRNAGG